MADRQDGARLNSRCPDPNPNGWEPLTVALSGRRTAATAFQSSARDGSLPAVGKRVHRCLGLGQICAGLCAINLDGLDFLGGVAGQFFDAIR